MVELLIEEEAISTASLDIVCVIDIFVDVNKIKKEMKQGEALFVL